MEQKKYLITERLELFESLARKEFEFLETRFAFKLVAIEHPSPESMVIRYESKKIFVDLGYYSPEYELSFNLGRLAIEKANNKSSICFLDLYYLSGISSISEVDSSVSAYELRNLELNLPKLARLLEELGSDCLQGNNEPFDLILKLRQKDCNAQFRIQELEQIKQDADSAWQRKDYHAVANFYSQISNDLTNVEIKRLSYAKRFVQ